MTRQERDYRGYTFDRYHIDPDRLRQIVHDVAVIRYLLAKRQAGVRQAGRIEVIATLPDHVPLDPEVRRTIPALAATLHRLITEAEKELVILNPFFEASGFDRLEAALIEAARRGVTITIVSHRLSESSSLNRRVIGKLIRKAVSENLIGHFKVYEYRTLEGRTSVTLHAKVLMADGRTAYVGSANLTEYGLMHNLEIGLLIEGPHLHQLQDILRAILQSDQVELVNEFP